MIFRRVALFLAMAFGLVTSQLPEFAQQYRQRLGGALDEIHRFLDQFDSEAAGQGLTRPQGVQRLEANPDQLAQGRGRSVADTEARERKLSRQLQSLQAPDAVGRMVALGEYFDSDVARRAMQSYEPAVPVTAEGIGIGLVGFVFGLALVHFVAWPIRRRRGKYRRDRDMVHST